MRISSVCPRMRLTLLGTNLEAIPRESLGQLRLPRPKDLEDFWQNKQKENEKVRAFEHTSSRASEIIENEAVGTCVTHHRSGSDHH